MNDTKMEDSADQPMMPAAQQEQPLNVIRDTNSSYNQFLVCGSLFEVPAKYMPIKPIGKGAYGIVW
jgi:mitogen-activated protein kinase 6